MNEREAFFQICQDATPAERSYVSLYAKQPYYGGPEEGGWWGTDYVLVAYRECSNDVEAKAVEEQVDLLALQLSAEAKEAFGRQCQAECDWLESRGLDADYLPEPDGEVTYWVTTESRPGENASEGSRHYE